MIGVVYELVCLMNILYSGFEFKIHDRGHYLN